MERFCVVQHIEFEEPGWEVNVWVLSISQLGGLKRKSLLEDFGDGRSNIVMHDLWHEFCMAETKAGKLGDRWWVYSEEERRPIGESSPGGGCWEKVMRICLVGEGWRSLRGVQLIEFANVTILKVEIGSIIPPSALDLDVSGLRHLKSLELETEQFFSKIVGLGSLRELVYLSWIREGASNSACIEEIGRLTKLEVLWLGGFTNAEMPDLSMLTSLREAWISGFRNAVTVTGLSSKLSKLRFLGLEWCEKLRDIPGLGELYALEYLSLWGCVGLKEVPFLGRLKRLRVLNLSECDELRAVPGLGDLVALQELYGERFSVLANVADMLKLTELRFVEISGLAGLDVVDVGVFHSLESLSVYDCVALRSVTCSGLSRALTVIRISECASLEEMPDLSTFPQLEELFLENCAGLMSLTSSVPLHTLRFLQLRACRKLRALPGSEEQFECIGLEALTLEGCEELKEVPCVRLLTRLRVLEISGCKLLRAVPGLSHLIALERFLASGCDNLGNLPDMRMLTKLTVLDRSGTPGLDSLDLGFVPRQLQEVDFSRCAALMSVTCSGSLCALSEIKLTGCSSLEEMPDLSNFPQLEHLDLKGCVSLMSLTSSAPLHALEILDLRECGKLTALPNHLSSSENLEELRLKKSGIVLSEDDIRRLKASCMVLRISADYDTKPLANSKSVVGGEIARSIPSTSCRQDMGDSNEELHEMEVQSYKQFLLRRLLNSVAGVKVRSPL